MEANNKIKIFVLYHDKNLPLFKNDVYQPLLTGAKGFSNNETFLLDNIGDNISNKNINYAELTGQYWVAKNFVKNNPEIEYIGFCHYRRFFDFFSSRSPFPFEKLSYKTFQDKFFKKQDITKIYEQIKDYDIIVPQTDKDIINEYDRIIKYHPKEAIDKAIQIVKDNFPEYNNAIDTYLNGQDSYICLNFVLKKELFINWVDWIMTICNKLEKELDLTKYNSYYSERIFAYIAERFFNIWLIYQNKQNNKKIKHFDSYLLIHIAAIEYSFLGIKFYKEKNGERYLNIFDHDIILDLKRICRWCIKHLSGREV